MKSTGLTDEQFSERLLYEKHVIAVPGSVFGESGVGHLRCSYATSMDQLKEALARISDLLQEIQKEQAPKIRTRS